MIYPIVSYRAIPEAHTYLPCRLDTEDSIHPCRRKRARFCTLPPYRFVRRLASSSPPRGDAERNMAIQASEAEQRRWEKMGLRPA